MDRDQFWNIIEQTRQDFSSQPTDANREGQIKALRQILLKYPAKEVKQFDDIFYTCIFDAYIWELWGAGHILCEGCSDDSFADFRSWLISMGRHTYEDALDQPESLAVVVKNHVADDFRFEEFAYIAGEVYEELSGKTLPPSGLENPSYPEGEKLWETFEDLQWLYPKIWSAVQAKDSDSLSATYH